MNNFCINIQSNEPRCTSCHAGYGWKDKTFDFSNPHNVDCLACHEQTGTYHKFPTGAGNPVAEPTLFKEDGKTYNPPEWNKVAQSVSTGFLYWGYNSWAAWGLSWLSLKVIATIHLAGAFGILSFLIVHLYMITTGHTIFAHTRAMISGWELVAEGTPIDDWERKERKQPAECS